MHWLFILLFSLILQAPKSEVKWTIDNAHSNVNFAFQWMQNSFRTGEYKIFDGSIILADEYSFQNAQISFSADVNSIDLIASSLSKLATGEVYLDAPQFPTIKFESKSIKKKKRNIYIVKGDLTIKGTTKSVNMVLEDHGISVYESRLYRAIAVRGEINKNDFKIYGNDERLGNIIKIIAYFECAKID
jgi:polyisoprenoid-binding protein YceI